MEFIRVEDRYSLIPGDAREALTDVRGVFDIILTDPPYGMGAEGFGDAAGQMAHISHGYDDSPEAFEAIMSWFIPLTWQVTKPEAHLYMFCDIDRFIWLRERLAAVGWWVHRTPLVNVKRTGRVPWPEHGPRRVYELVLYAVKGRRPSRVIAPDVFESVMEADEVVYGHGAQKPVGVYAELLRRSALPGDVVLDAFAGTGPLLEAAHRMSLRAVVIERDPVSLGYCLQRLEGLK